jgi:nucleotide-binding universal stress UspA family protein
MYETIVVATNGSDEAAAAEDHAVDLADRYGSEIHGLFVVDPEVTPISSSFSASEVEDLFFDGTEHPANDLQARADGRDIPATTETRMGHPDDEIINCADTVDADLVVMGPHGRSGIERRLLGSTTERTLRKADIPLLCVQSATNS